MMRPIVSLETSVMGFLIGLAMLALLPLAAFLGLVVIVGFIGGFLQALFGGD